MEDAAEHRSLARNGDLGSLRPQRVRNESRVKRMVEERKSNLFRGKTKEVGGSLQGFMPKAGNRSGNKLGTATSNNVILLDGLAF